MQGSSTSTRASTSTTTSSDKPADYVYFERSSSGFSDDAIPRAKTAQLKLEHFYKVAVDAAIERNTRYAFLTASVNTSTVLMLDLQGALNWRESSRQTS